MRSLFYLGLVLYLPNFIAAQTLNDITYLTQTSLSGTARYTAMAGAFGALGGELSAISDNPAASAVFLNTELGGTINFQAKNHTASYFGTLSDTKGDDFYMDQLGAVFVFNNTNTDSPWSRISTAINVNRIETFDQQISVFGSNNKGIVDYFLFYADGVAFEDIQLYDEESIASIYKYLGDTIGYGAQQTFLGFHSFIIDPFTNDPSETSYFSNVDSSQYQHDLRLTNLGFHRKTSFNFSALYRNVLHLGVNVNAHYIEFEQKHDFFEGEQDLNSSTYDINFVNELLTFGRGQSIQFGAILKLKGLRLGLSYVSPQWIEIQDETSQSLSTYRFQDGFEIQEIINPDVINSFAPYQLKIPSKTSLSAAYVFNSLGLLSFEYSSQDLSNTESSINGGSSFLDALNTDIKSVFGTVNTLKMGGELRFKDLSFRGGYLNSSKKQNSTSIEDQAITLGLGFDLGASSLNFSFINYKQNQQFELFSEGLSDSYELTKKLRQFSMSLNFKL